MEKLQKVFKKYCNGEFLFDHPASKSGRFQASLMSLTSKALLGFEENDQSFSSTQNLLEFLTSQCLDFLTQIFEEAMLYAHSSALQNQTNEIIKRQAKEDKLITFMQLALTVF